MPNFTNSERAAFNEDLNRFMDDETRQDRRDEYVEARVEELLRDEYHPFKPAHVQEAVSELNFADSILLGSYANVANELHMNDTAQINLADFLCKVCKEYWHNLAVHKAQAEYDKAGF